MGLDLGLSRGRAFWAPLMNLQNVVIVIKFVQRVKYLIVFTLETITSRSWSRIPKKISATLNPRIRHLRFKTFFTNVRSAPKSLKKTEEHMDTNNLKDLSIKISLKSMKLKHPNWNTTFLKYLVAIRKLGWQLKENSQSLNGMPSFQVKN